MRKVVLITLLLTVIALMCITIFGGAFSGDSFTNFLLV